MANENMNATAQDPAKPAVATPTVAPVVTEPKHAPEPTKVAPAQSAPVSK